MPRGGKLGNHGGRPKGSTGIPQKSTIEKRLQDEILRARIMADRDAFYEALKASALGVFHMTARDADGTWKEVTDPAQMVKCLNSGESFYRIHARNPDVSALRDLFNRLCGLPAQSVDVTLHDDVAAQSDDELMKEAAVLLAKMRTT